MTVRQLRGRRLALLGARAGVVLCATMTAITGFGLSRSGLPGAAAATVAGAATVVTPCDSPDGCQPLEGGSSETAFSLLLPVGAACTGDSANDGFNVTSFMVAGDVDVTSLQFDPITGPQPQAVGDQFRQPLYETGSGSAYTGRQTAAATEPGGPGPVINIPAFDFASVGYSPGDIPVGRYTIGVACILGAPSPTQVDNMWTARIDVSAADGDPLGIAWAAVDDPVPTSTTAAGGSTSTTGSDGSTSTTAEGDPTSTTSTADPTSSTSSTGSSSSTVAGTGGTGPTTGSFGGSLPATGSSPVALVLWALLLLTCGRLAVVLSRPPRVPVTRA